MNNDATLIGVMGIENELVYLDWNLDMQEYPASNEALAKLYEPEFSQFIIIYPLCWKHVPFGDWYLAHIIS